MSQPIISFIIPVLNGEKYIARCLDAILNQQCQNWEFEIIVVDNGSKDNTRKIVQQKGLPCEMLLNRSVSALRNYAARKARGSYLAFIDADVEIGPGWIQEAESLIREGKAVAAGCFPTVPSHATWVQEAWDVHQQARQQRSSMKGINWLPSMNLLVNRDVFFAIDGFNENLPTAEDVDLCYRLSKYGTIFCDPGMAAIHWGEACDLRTFWRKEVWRGLGNLKGILSHGFRWDELPSIGYPSYVLALVIVLAFGGFFDFFNQQFFIVPISLLLLVIPPLMLSARTARLTKSFRYLPQLFVLYLVYGFARAYALVKSFSLRN